MIWTPGLLGHGEGVTRLNTPTRLPSPLGGERAVSFDSARAPNDASAEDESDGPLLPDGGNCAVRRPLRGTYESTTTTTRLMLQQSAATPVDLGDLHRALPLPAASL